MVRSPDVPKKTATARERQEKAEEKKTRGREKEPGMRQRQEGEEAADLGNKEMTRGTIGNRGNCVGNGRMWGKKYARRTAKRDRCGPRPPVSHASGGAEAPLVIRCIGRKKEVKGGLSRS